MLKSSQMKSELYKILYAVRATDHMLQFTMENMAYHLTSRSCMGQY